MAVINLIRIPIARGYHLADLDHIMPSLGNGFSMWMEALQEFDVTDVSFHLDLVKADEASYPKSHFSRLSPSH